MTDRPPPLVDKHGRPLQRGVLKKDVAGPTLTGVRSVISGYPADGLTPDRLAVILRQADQGDPLRFFELAELIEERDPHYTGVLSTRKRSVSQLEIVVDAASDDADHMRHADMVRDWIERDELSGELFDILDAIGKGISMTEIIWDTSEGQWKPERLEWRDPRWFTFDRSDGKTPLLRTDSGDQALPPFKFIQTVIKAKSGLPIRSGIARVAVWAWMFKAFSLRDWAIFVQSYGQPIRVGKYGAGASDEDKETLFRAVANIAGDCAAIIPDSMLIDFIDPPATTNGSQLFRERADWLDQQISKVVLGQTTTTDAISGGHAVSKEHRQVQEDIERADAKELSATLNRDLVRPWVQLDSGPQKQYPKIRIGRRDEIELGPVVDAVEKLVPLGLRVAKSDMNELVGLPVPDDDADILAPPPAHLPIAGSETATAEPGELDDIDAEAATQARQAAIADTLGAGQPDGLDALREELEAQAQGATDITINKIAELVRGAETLEDVRAALLRLSPDLPQDQLAGALRAALAFAELSGRDEADSSDA